MYSKQKTNYYDQTPKYNIGDIIVVNKNAKVHDNIMITKGTKGVVVMNQVADHGIGKVWKLTRRGYPAVWVKIDDVPFLVLLYYTQVDLDVACDTSCGCKNCDCGQYYDDMEHEQAFDEICREVYGHQ